MQLTPIDRIHKTKQGIPLLPVPRGEVWMGSDFLARAGFSDTLDNHIRMAEQLGHDLICLPVCRDATSKPGLGYRYFIPENIAGAVKNSDRFIAAAVDGPFQELVNQKGLVQALMGWMRDRDGMMRAYIKEMEKSLELIKEALARGAHAIVITDDLAAEQGPMIRPADIDAVCTGFYEQAVHDIHDAGCLALLHSCGKITGLTDMIKKWHLDGLAAIQHSANDLVRLQTLLPGCILMAGIDGALLETDPSPKDLDDFLNTFQKLMNTGGIILSSACGCYSGAFLERVKKIYKAVDTQISIL